VFLLLNAQGIAVVDNLLLLTTFPLYCINPVVDFFQLDATVYQQYCHALVIAFVVPLAFLAHSATVWSTTLIGINRYVAVCHPYQVVMQLTATGIVHGWLGGPVVSAIDLRLDGREFDSRPPRLVLGWVTVFGRANHVLTISPCLVGR